MNDIPIIQLPDHASAEALERIDGMRVRLLKMLMPEFPR